MGDLKERAAAGYWQVAVPVLLAMGSLAMSGCQDLGQSDGRSSGAVRGGQVSSGRMIGESRGMQSRGVGSMPVNLVISPDGKYAITSSSGFRERLVSIRLSDNQQVGNLDFPGNKANPNGLYYGLVFGPDGKLYAAMGQARKVAVVSLGADGSLALEKELAMGTEDFPAGLAADKQGRLFVTHNDPTSGKLPFGTPASLSVLDAGTGKELGRYIFEDDLGLSNFPLAIAVNDAASRVYVGSQRDDAVYVLDATDGAHVTLHKTIATGSHPVALLLNKDRSKLFVANAQSDTISIVDTASETVTGTILLRPQVARDLAGATPTGLALSTNEKMLYATLGDMNAVAVVDLAESGGPKVEGYIPTGWYPTAAAVVGRELLITNAKGDQSRTPHDFSQGTSVVSPLNLFEGTLWRMSIPREADLAKMTQASLENARLTPKYLQGENPLQGISRQGMGAGKIQHVIYVVKENRTYDQVLGDLPQGNGDPKRCLFPREVTPNQHALAERFILLDNFYDSGDVSGDGWTWSTQAQANEYTVRNVPYLYSQRGRKYDFEGTNNSYPTGGFPALGPDGKPLSDDARFSGGAKPVSDVAASPGGHLWDMAEKHGVSYRNYGFFVTEGLTQGGKVVIPDNYPSVRGLQPGGHDLAGVTDADYRRFDLDFPDSDAPALLSREQSDPAFLWKTHNFGKAATGSRIAEWKREFAMMLARDPTGKAVPNFMTVRLGTDHTSGASAGKPSPRCMVADNDYAVGELVEAVSHSPIWLSTAIIIIEDDAQNGPDHVDAHRSTCYVVSPWIRRGTVDHSFQNTVSAVRTIESLLNLPPMCQYDAASGVIGGWDDQPRNSEAFMATIPPAAIMRQRNVRPAGRGAEPEEDVSPATRSGGGTSAREPALKTADDLARVSATMDFSKADHAPADLLNQIIWKSVKGVDSEMPPTPHVPGRGAAWDDDD